jgi:hypothetical protein
MSTPLAIDDDPFMKSAATPQVPDVRQSIAQVSAHT